MALPSLVGGTLVTEDLAPSIVFIILYGSLVPLAAFRLLGRTSRTALLIGTILFLVERVVIFSLRAIQSRNEEKAGSHGLASYEQFTIGLGYIGISQDLVNFLKVLLVNTTKPDSSDESPTSETRPDRPQARTWYRNLCGYMNLAFLSAIVPGIVAGSQYSSGISNPQVAARVMRLRYASSGVALFLTSAVGVISLVALRKIRGVNKSAGLILVILSSLLSTVAIYRLAVMHHTTDSLLSRGPNSLSSPTAKALFYVFHMLPEWLACAIIIGLNMRQIFVTGFFGDWRATDKPKKNNEEQADKSIPLQQTPIDLI